MSEEIAQALAELNRQVDGAEGEELALALTRRAALYTAQADYEKAEGDLKRASDAWFRLNRPRDQGRTEYARARIVAQADLPRAAEFFRRAASMARVGGDADTEIKCREGLAAALGALGDYEAALAETRATGERLGALGDALAHSANLRSQATLLQLVGRPNKALEAFDEAVRVAAEAGHTAAALQARIERRGQVQFTVSPEREPLDQLVAEAQALGLPTLAGQARLQLAAERLRLGHPVEAAALADEARQEALDHVQPVLYLMACIALGEAREAQGDRAGVIAILLTCKQTLQDTLGREAAQPVLRLLDALEERWGAEGLEVALAEYRERARQGPL